MRLRIVGIFLEIGAGERGEGKTGDVAERDQRTWGIDEGLHAVGQAQGGGAAALGGGKGEGD